MKWDTPRGAKQNWFDEELTSILGMSGSPNIGSIPARHHKTPSLPTGWPNPATESLAERPRRLIDVGTDVDQKYSFTSNVVTTSKFTLANFVPLFLLEEFNPRTKFANCYFLLIASLQCIPPISNTHGYPTTLFPLLIVVIVDGIFQIIEDISRHTADRTANASVAHR
jgi:hypothetical protein